MIRLANPNASSQFAERFAKAFAQVLPELPSPAGLSIHLLGDLGAGKTFFTRAFLTALGVKGRIKSPTYTVVETYQAGPWQLAHLDIYRFADATEWEDAGLDDVLASSDCSLIEWATKAEGSLPTPDLILNLRYDGEGRSAEWTAHTEAGARILAVFEGVDGGADAASGASGAGASDAASDAASAEV